MTNSSHTQHRLLVTGGSGFIGTNLIGEWRTRWPHILNLDIAPPADVSQRSTWVDVDILDAATVRHQFDKFSPTHVIHLASRTDCDENTTVEKGYTVNTEGTQNILSAVRDSHSVDRAIITSTQYVCGPGHLPKDDEDYAPHTVYGQSKAISERRTRATELSCIWTLIRPVNIWGPWHFRYRREFLRVLRRGWYCHPGRQPVVRTYGYVGNVVWQMERMFESSGDVVNRKVYYVGDRPIDIYEWVNTFSLRMRGQPVRTVPRRLVRSLGLVGDVLERAGFRSPITSSRYQSMTQDYVTPLEATFDAFGSPPFSLEDGVIATLEWLEHCNETEPRATSEQSTATRPTP